MRNLGIFRWFLDAFASWMRVYMFYIEKVSKIGLFWLSLFLCYLPLVYSGCHLMGKYILLVMGFGVYCIHQGEQEKRENVRESRD